jgi:hypothetical protein
MALPYAMDLAVSKSGGEGKDLLLYKPSIFPGSVAAGGTVQAVFDVYNTGTQALGQSTEARLLLSTDATPSADDVVLGTQAIPALASLAKQSVSLSGTLAEDQVAGSYTVFLQLDPGQLISETYEDNNQFEASLTVTE